MSDLQVVGQVLDVLEPEVLDASKSRELTRQIKVALEHSYTLIIAAYRGRAWLAMGYSTWDGYCQGEFGNLALQPPREERREVIMSLRDAGMSVRAIAAGTDLSKSMIAREIRLDELGGHSADTGGTDLQAFSGVPNGTPDDRESSRVVGMDGKSYPAAPVMPTVDPAVKFVDVPLSDELLDMAPGAFGINVLSPADLPVRPRRERVRAAAALTGRMDRPLPMLIKLAGEISLDDSVLAADGDSDVELLGELAGDAGRGVLALSHVLNSIDTSSVLLEAPSRAMLAANIQDAVDELGRFLDALHSGKIRA